jgi:hypothetical protein
LARKERHILTRHLESLPAHFKLYATTLNSPVPVNLADFLTIVKAFREGIRDRFGESVQYRPEVEVAPESRKLHVHLAMWSEGEGVKKADVVSIWRAAWGGYEGRMNVDHSPIDDIPTWARYMLKADEQWHEPANPSKCVVLFARGTPRLPQATGGFFRGKTKAELWREWIAERHPAEVQSEPRNTSENTEDFVRFKGGKTLRKHHGDSSVPLHNPYSKTTLRYRQIGIIKRRRVDRNRGFSRNRAQLLSRSVRPRNHWKARSTGPMPERRLEARLGPMARSP